MLSPVWHEGSIWSLNWWNLHLLWESVYLMLFCYFILSQAVLLNLEVSLFKVMRLAWTQPGIQSGLQECLCCYLQPLNISRKIVKCNLLPEVSIDIFIVMTAKNKWPFPFSRRSIRWFPSSYLSFLNIPSFFIPYSFLTCHFSHLKYPSAP